MVGHKYRQAPAESALQEAVLASKPAPVAWPAESWICEAATHKSLAVVEP